MDNLLHWIHVQNAFQNPLILILADAHCPGGCVRAGAGMQEESLFRRSALFKHLTLDMYPIEKTDALYAADVQLIDGTCASFVACPGIKMPQLTNDNKFNKTDIELLKTKVELILQIADKFGHSSIILGAMGCGVWGCPPREVAQIFKDVLLQNDGVVSDVIIAVLGANYNFFNDVFTD